MKKAFVAVAALLAAGLFSMDLMAQSHQRSRSLYGELLGASQGIGINYDARFNRGKSDGFGWRTGLGFGYAYSSNFVAFNIDGDVVDTYNQMFRAAVPLELNYLLGKKNSKLETGGGAALCMDIYTSDTGARTEASFGVVTYLSVGYRLVTHSGFLFRVGVLPSFNFDGSNLSLYPYIGFGKAF